ncbi:MAG: TM2 domain-containing protein [Alphaproteobacteria bacterium]|nr:TM2 domain-containing protein [Alphaproteobacteria bacterium]
MAETRPASAARGDKSMLLAYAVWFFPLGALGIHRFYLGATESAFILLALTVVSSVLNYVGVGPLLGLVVVIWLIVDIFLIPGMVRAANG